MPDSHQIRIERKPEILKRTGWSRSTLHAKINQGLFPPLINLGPRAVGIPSHETTAIIQAMIAGKSPDEIHAVVLDLLGKRLEMGGAV